MVGNSCIYFSSLSHPEYCQMDRRESKVCRVRQEGQACLVYRGKKDLLVTKERRATEVFLASLGLRVFVEREEVLELRASPVRRVRKENPLL